MTESISVGVLSIAAASVFAVVLSAAVQERDRAKIPDQFKWDLTQIYAGDDAWRDAKEKLKTEIPKVKAFKGTLATSAARLADALELGNRLSKELSRAYVYASMMSDQDTRVSSYRGMQQEMIQIAASLGAETAFFEPEVLKM